MERLFLLQQPLAWGRPDMSSTLSHCWSNRHPPPDLVPEPEYPWGWRFALQHGDASQFSSLLCRWQGVDLQAGDGALGLAFLFPGLLLSAQKQVMSWAFSSYGYQWPETAEKKMERGPGGHLGPWWPCGSATQVRTADLHFSQTCFKKSCCKGLVTGSWEQVLTDPGFLWLTPIPLWGQMASLLF